MRHGRSGKAAIGAMALLMPIGTLARPPAAPDRAATYRLRADPAWPDVRAAPAPLSERMRAAPADRRDDAAALPVQDRLTDMLAIPRDLRFVVNGSVKDAGPERMTLGLRYATLF